MSTPRVLLSVATLLVAACSHEAANPNGGTSGSGSTTGGPVINSGGGIITCPTPGQTQTCCGTGTMTCSSGEIPTFGPCVDAHGMQLSCCIPAEFGSCDGPDGGKSQIGSTDAGTGTGGNGGGGGNNGGVVGLAPMCKFSYPFTSSNPRTSVIFNESSVLTGVSPAIAHAGDVIKAFYIDEHALTLGANGNGHTVSPFAANLNAVAGSSTAPTLSVGDPAAADPAGRPLYPALFLTDITSDASSTAGDWQNNGTAIPPTGVFGTWKTANGADPPQNLFDVGNGDMVPRIAAGGHDYDKQFYSAEAQWTVSALGLQPGHSYRVQIMMHDGDQNQSGGDVGEGCVTIQGQ
jgi:hypothetical protein